MEEVFMIALFASLIPGFIAILPVFGSRYIPTHDGEYHIIRFWQFYASLAGGNWFPRWAPDLNHGYGIPLFTFQYPFPNYVGSLFHLLGISFVDSVKWTLGSGYLLALLFCFLWIRRIFGSKPAVSATIACAFVPYWFIDVYIRGSVGEVWAIAWVFAALYAIVSGRRLLLTAVTALLIVSHNIMALVCTPILFVYAYIHHKRMMADILLGVGAASFFWIPALYEQRYIQGLSRVHIFDYFPRIDQLLIPSWGSGFRGQTTGGNEMSYQIGLIPILLFVWTGVVAVRRRILKFSKELCFALACMGGAIFFMTPWSGWVWRIIPFAHFIQYPWRLLSIVVLMTPVFAGYIAARFRFGWMVAVFAVLFSFGYSRPVTYEPRTDGYYLSQPSFTQGTNSMGNAFQTIWFTGADNPASDFSLSSGVVAAARVQAVRYHIVTVATQEGVLTTPLAYYPGWLLQTEKRSIPGKADAHGILTFDVAEGRHEGVIRLGLTPWQIAAGVLSIFSLSVAVVSFILRKQYEYRH